LLQEGHLTMGHAKVLLGLDDDDQISALAQEIVSEGFTVREVEQKLRKVVGDREGKKTGRPRGVDRQPPEVRRIEERLRRSLQTDVAIKVGPNNRGTLTVNFYSADDLNRLLELMGVPD
jgi:ParB family transcriptional regulator, chromosome partitioning protein